MLGPFECLKFGLIISKKATYKFSSSLEIRYLSITDETLFSETTTVAQDARIGYLCVHASLIFAFGCPVPLPLHTAFNGFLNCDQSSTVKGTPPFATLFSYRDHSLNFGTLAYFFYLLLLLHLFSL